MHISPSIIGIINDSELIVAIGYSLFLFRAGRLNTSDADHQGPVSTYMTSCDGDCTTFSAAGARWFKLDAAGYYGADRQWAADKLRESGSTL